MVSILGLKKYSSKESDNISAHYLYNCRYSIPSYFLFLLFWYSLTESVFPSVWRILIVTLVFISDDQSDV